MTNESSTAETVETRVYLGHFGKEKFLFTSPLSPAYFNKDNFIYYEGESYKILYSVLCYEDNEYSVFIRLATEEDF